MKQVQIIDAIVEDATHNGAYSAKVSSAYTLAKLYAATQVVMADAAIETWKEKYRHNLWRPVIGIHWGNNDSMPGTVGDPSWEPLGSPMTNTVNMSVTPAFPRCARARAHLHPLHGACVVVRAAGWRVPVHCSCRPYTERVIIAPLWQPGSPPSHSRRARAATPVATPRWAPRAWWPRRRSSASPTTSRSMRVPRLCVSLPWRPPCPCQAGSWQCLCATSEVHVAPDCPPLVWHTSKAVACFRATQQRTACTYGRLQTGAGLV
jgi:hypothetical protein